MIIAELSVHVQIANAISLLMPGVEVVLHDLSSQTVVHISGNFSRRVVGEPSLLDEIAFDASQAIIGPYEKTNWDGRRIKSISIVIPGANGPVGVLCINMDVSHFHSIIEVLGGIVSVPDGDEKPLALFKEDWHERINEYIQHWTKERGVLVTALTRAEKKELVADLSADGAFGGRNAAEYIGRILGLGRATIYNYLRKKTKPDNTG